MEKIMRFFFSMRFFLRLILGILTTLFIGIVFITIGEVDTDSLVNLLFDFSDYTSIFPTVFFVLWLIRVFILITEYFLLRSYLISSTNKLKKLLYVNVETFVTLSVLFFFMLPLLKITWLPGYLTQVIVLVLAGLVGLCEVYIKLDFIKKRHLTRNFSKVTKILMCIIIPAYILCMGVILLLIYMQGHI